MSMMVMMMTMTMTMTMTITTMIIMVTTTITMMIKMTMSTMPFVCLKYILVYLCFKPSLFNSILDSSAYFANDDDGDDVNFVALSLTVVAGKLFVIMYVMRKKVKKAQH